MIQLEEKEDLVTQAQINWPELYLPPINLWNVWKMPEPKDTVRTSFFKGYTNWSCEFYPCHDMSDFTKNEFNCLFCYCPLQYLNCPGPYKVFIDKNGIKRKDCTDCILPHNTYKKSWNFIQVWLEKPEPWNGE
jgi:Zn-finger protein